MPYTWRSGPGTFSEPICPLSGCTLVIGGAGGLWGNPTGPWVSTLGHTPPPPWGQGYAFMSYTTYPQWIFTQRDLRLADLGPVGISLTNFDLNGPHSPPFPITCRPARGKVWLCLTSQHSPPYADHSQRKHIHPHPLWG